MRYERNLTKGSQRLMGLSRIPFTIAQDGVPVTMDPRRTRDKHWFYRSW